MLGKRPRPNLLRTTSKSQLNAACSRISEEASIATNTIGTQNKSYGSSHVVVVGFKLASEAVHEACDSPRSVLEPGALCCRDVSSAISTNSPNSVSKSPRSILGSLLSSPGVGLGIVAAMKTQESVAKKNTVEAPKVSRPVPVPATTMASGRAANVNTNGKSHLNYYIDGGFAQHAMDHVYYANCGTQSGIRHVNYANDGSQNVMKHVNYVVADGNHNPDAMNHTHCDDINILHSHDDADGEDEDEDDLVENDNVDDDAHVSEDVICEDDEDDEDDDDQKLNVDHDMGIKQSIFSTASPASSCCGFGNQGRDFLSSCYLCKRRLGQGSDIYMYRGDQAFCSAECRYQQIALDDYKERRSAAATNCYTGSSSHHHRMFAVASPAVA